VFHPHERNDKWAWYEKDAQNKGYDYFAGNFSLQGYHIYPNIFSNHKHTIYENFLDINFVINNPNPTISNDEILYYGHRY
jgi:hypothetical protein